MPLPYPVGKEKYRNWIRRCMSNEKMKEFEDLDQRFAICLKIWKKAKGFKEDDKSV